MSDKQPVDTNMLTLLIAMIQVESRALFPCEKKHILGWFYQKALSKEKAGLSFYHISDGRDKNAYNRTETFRKTLFGKDMPITPDFLGTIVNKLWIFGQGTLVTWQDFLRDFQKPFETYIRQFSPAYALHAQANPHHIHDISNQRWYYAEHFARDFYKLMIKKGVLGQNKHVIIAAGPEALFVKLHKEDLSMLNMYEGLNQQYPKMIHYDREQLYDRNPDCFYGSYNGAGTYSETVTLLPIIEGAFNKRGRMIEHLRVVPPNVCRPGEYEKMQLLLVRLGSSRQQIYPHLLIEIIKSMLGSFYSPDIRLIIPGDSPIHSKFIINFSAAPTNLEVKYDLLQGAPGYGTVRKISQMMFTTTLDRLAVLAGFNDYTHR